MKKTKINLLIIDNQDSFTFNLVDFIYKLQQKNHLLLNNFSLEIHSSSKLELDYIEKFSHILISPGADKPSSYPLLAKFLQRYQTHKKILGICLGQQAIAEFFGGKLINLAQPRHGQTGYLNILDQNIAQKIGLKDQQKVGLYHSWAVEIASLPKELNAVALDQAGVLMAISDNSQKTVAVQFHPESIISENCEDLMLNFLLNQ